MGRQPGYSRHSGEYFCLPPSVFQEALKEVYMDWLTILLSLIFVIYLMYAVLMFRFYLGVKKTVLKQFPGKTKGEANDPPLVKVSVIIPVRNEAHQITRCLETIRDQDFHIPAMEVLITDDFSDDQTITIAREYAVTYPEFPLKIIIPEENVKQQEGKKRAMERAIEMATGEIILTTDADTERLPGWIRSMTEHFSNSSIQMVSGAVVFHREENILEKMLSLEFLGIMGITCGAVAAGVPVMCNGANLAFRRMVFKNPEGYSGHKQIASGDDIFLMLKIKKLFGGSSIRFNTHPDAVVFTKAPATIREFFYQRLRWISKSGSYQDGFLISLSLLTYLTSFVIWLVFMITILQGSMLWTGLLLLFIKMLTDFPIVSRMASCYHKERLLPYFFFAQLFQVIYVPVVGLLGFVVPYHWKGRWIKR
jgi:cellulose synthase/poly-beta-1,6-N-acetylglucosamine synthase-like glycosyltransferase